MLVQRRRYNAMLAKFTADKSKTYHPILYTFRAQDLGLLTLFMYTQTTTLHFLALNRVVTAC
jgi:hypothetical protein